jgi:hypothetical protein
MTFKVGAAETTYLASAARAGMVPFRAVMLDKAFNPTAMVGGDSRAEILYPATTHNDGDTVIGVVMGPTDTLARDEYASAEYPIKQGVAATVRMHGWAPMRADSTVGGAPILAGDYVKCSNTANFDGMAAKGTLTNNAPAADQHIVGICLNRVDAEQGVALVMVRPVEA